MGQDAYLVSTRISVARRKARKPYRCWWGCHQGILPGEQYRREYWIVDGEPVVYRMHDTSGYCAQNIEDAGPLWSEEA